MAFQFKASQSAAKNIRRLTRKQLDKALRSLRDKSGSDESIHTVRTCFKKARALARLVRGELGSAIYRRENITFRDAARPLTEVREAAVMIKTVDDLERRCAGRASPAVFLRMREALSAEFNLVRARILEQQGELGRIATIIESARRRIKHWAIPHHGWPVLAAGLKKVYRAGRQARARAFADPSTVNLHEWRKQAKYLWYQLQIFRRNCPRWRKKLGDRLHQLTELLGDDHDLDVFSSKLVAEPEKFGGRAPVDAVMKCVDQRRRNLRRDAFAVGRRAYRDKPGAFVDRISACRP